VTTLRTAGMLFHLYVGLLVVWWHFFYFRCHLQ